MIIIGGRSDEVQPKKKKENRFQIVPVRDSRRGGDPEEEGRYCCNYVKELLVVFSVI